MKPLHFYCSRAGFYLAKQYRNDVFAAGGVIGAQRNEKKALLEYRKSLFNIIPLMNVQLSFRLF